MKDKTFRNELIKLSIPLIIEELISTLIGSIGILLAGTIINEQNKISAISISFQIFFIFNMTSLGAVFVSSMLFSQFFGNKNKLNINKTYFYSQLIVILISSIFLFISLVFPKQIISILVAQPEVIELATPFLRLYSISFIFTSISAINQSLLKSMGHAKKSALCSILSLTTNIIFSSIFLYGLLKKIDYYGIAYAVIITRVFQALITTIFVFCFTKIKLLNPFKDKEFNKKIINIYIKIGIPLILSKLFWATGFTAINSIMNQLETNITFVNQIISTMKTYVICISTGVSIAIGIILSKEIGEGNLDKVRQRKTDIRKFILYVGLIQVSLSLLELPLSLLIYKNSLNEETHKLLIIFFLIYSFTYIFQANNGIIENGVSNAGGDTLYVSIIDAVVPWLILFPIGYIMLKSNVNPIAIYVVISLDEIIRAPINFIRMGQGKWVRNVTRNF